MEQGVGKLKCHSFSVNRDGILYHLISDLSLVMQRGWLCGAACFLNRELRTIGFTKDWLLVKMNTVEIGVLLQIDTATCIFFFCCGIVMGTVMKGVHSSKFTAIQYLWSVGSL